MLALANIKNIFMAGNNTWYQIYCIHSQPSREYRYLKFKICVVNAFSSEPFKGNPAAVIINDEYLGKYVMQRIAAENNLSETSFIKLLGADNYSIRWFLPTSVGDACGHATLAYAWVLSNKGKVGGVIRFQTQVIGKLTATLIEDGLIQMSFPSRKEVAVEKIPTELISGLSIQPKAVLISDQAYFVVYENEKGVKNVIRKKDILADLSPLGVVVTALSVTLYFVSRYFWPGVADGEDPVTGSIHAGLAPYWTKRLKKDELVAFQCSARGGRLKCKVEIDRVLISGKAAHNLTGEINI